MSFFNFDVLLDKLPHDDVQINIKNIPEDYKAFLLTYNSVCPVNEYQDICIKVLDESVSILIYTIQEFLLEKNEDGFWPENYLAIAGDYEFQSVIMCLTGEEKGHIYYMDLETWQDYVMDEPEDIQIKAIKEHAIHIANSFTEFCGMLYLED